MKSSFKPIKVTNEIIVQIDQNHKWNHRSKSQMKSSFKSIKITNEIIDQIDHNHKWNHQSKSHIKSSFKSIKTTNQIIVQIDQNHKSNHCSNRSKSQIKSSFKSIIITKFYIIIYGVISSHKWNFDSFQITNEITNSSTIGIIPNRKCRLFFSVARTRIPLSRQLNMLENISIKRQRIQ
jgi:DNA polymerase III alpha subunit (gram-positive type)